MSSKKQNIERLSNALQNCSPEQLALINSIDALMKTIEMPMEANDLIILLKESLITAWDLSYENRKTIDHLLSRILTKIPSEPTLQEQDHKTYRFYVIKDLITGRSRIHQTNSADFKLSISEEMNQIVNGFTEVISFVDQSIITEKSQYLLILNSIERNWF